MAQELKAIFTYSLDEIEVVTNRAEGNEYCLKSEVDAVLAEKDAAIAELKDKLQAAEKQTENLINSASSLMLKQDAANDKLDAEIRRLNRALWLMRTERYKMREFIAREEANWHSLMAWSQFLRERTYNRWVDQLLRIANLANKLHNKCLAKVEEYK